ncbi:hypothetical protein CASFOL_042143 [Castilleja foliolosa]|uniref:Uncharacterized protein n=1 Tax=Castilleja foliolosa TaxID=1961234 RepID=A0ABD3B9Y2_9LAMI
MDTLRVAAGATNCVASIPTSSSAAEYHSREKPPPAREHYRLKPPPRLRRLRREIEQPREDPRDPIRHESPRLDRRPTASRLLASQPPP